MSNPRIPATSDIDDLQRKLASITDTSEIKKLLLEVNTASDKPLEQIFSELQALLAVAKTNLIFVNDTMALQNDILTTKVTLIQSQLNADQTLIQALAHIAIFTDKKTCTPKQFEVDQTALTNAYKAIAIDNAAVAKTRLPSLESKDTEINEFSDKLTKLTQTISQQSLHLKKFTAVKDYVNSSLSILKLIEKDIKASLISLHSTNEDFSKWRSAASGEVEVAKKEIRRLLETVVLIKVHLEKGTPINSESISNTSAAASKYAASQKLFTAAAKPNGQVHPASASIQPNKPK
jgi:hypothetical protein